MTVLLRSRWYAEDERHAFKRNMHYAYTRPLTDEELLRHLRSRDRVVIRVPGLRWQDIERHVERLGFGDLFLVSAASGKRGECCKIDPAEAA